MTKPHATLLEDRCLLSVELSANQPTVALVGSPVVWTATASGHGQSPVYQYRIGPTGGQPYVARDFSTSNTFTWNPMQQGTYYVLVIVKDSYTAATGESAIALYTVESRVVGSSAVVSPTSNPLVALYSAPPSSGRSMYVQFTPLGSNQPWSSTPEEPIVPGESTNFLVAGMLPDTTYLMRHVLDDGTTSAPVPFTTGSLPTNLTFPTFTVQKAPSPGTDLAENIVYHFGLGVPSGTVNTVATDLNGNIVWYYDPVAHAFASFATNLVPGGTILLLGGKALTDQGGEDSLQEVDLAGNTVRETNIYAVDNELAALGQPAITDFNHEALRLPNGDTAVLATTPLTIDVKGKPVPYNGDMVVVLDQNFQVAWVWDAFAWLNVHRLPTLGEGPSDWLHANSISWSPEDGDLVVSLRNQDQVIKIDYANGTGDGHVIWRLGQGGYFRINSSAQSPWFTHQHDVTFINDDTLVLFDNGNTRRSRNPRAQSRGQELILNESLGIASLVVNVDLGNYAAYTGSAQMLPDGNLVFDSPLVGQTIEVLPGGRSSYVLKTNSSAAAQYRSFIYPTVYGNPAGTSLPSTPIPAALERHLQVLERVAEAHQARLARIEATHQTRLARQVMAGRQLEHSPRGRTVRR